MNNPATQPFASHISPWRLLIITLVSSLLGFQLIGMFIGTLIAFPFYDGDFTSLLFALSDPINNPSIKTALIITQGIGSAFGMIFIPWLIYNRMFKIPLHFGQTKVSIQPILFTFLITLFLWQLIHPLVNGIKTLNYPLQWLVLNRRCS